MRPPTKRNGPRGGGPEAQNGTTGKPKHTLSASRRVAVITTKGNGVDVCFSTHDDRAEAEHVVEQLRNIGCTARIERARASDIPGMQRRAP